MAGGIGEPDSDRHPIAGVARCREFYPVMRRIGNRRIDRAHRRDACANSGSRGSRSHDVYSSWQWRTSDAAAASELYMGATCARSAVGRNHCGREPSAGFGHQSDAPRQVVQSAAVSDAVYLSGMPPGEYETHIGGNVVLTPEGRLHLARKPELLAGSAMMLADAVWRLAQSGLCTFPEAWDMASMRPAEAMGQAEPYGLMRGAQADFVVLEKRKGCLCIVETVKGGRSVYQGDC